MEDTEFQSFAKQFCPTYNLARHKTTFESLVLQLYESTLNNVPSNINEAFAICIMIDSCHQQKIRVLFIYWINTHAELKWILLKFWFLLIWKFMQFYKEHVYKWKIGNKVVSSVTYYATNSVLLYDMGDGDSFLVLLKL